MPACPHRPPCPGCPRWFEKGLPPRAREVFDVLAKQTDLGVPKRHSGTALGFRMRARLSVRGRAASPKIGIFQQGSHRIVDIPNCPIHHPAINEVVALVKRGIRETGTAPYAEAPHKGALRGVQIAIERATGKAQLVLVANAANTSSLDSLAEWLQAEAGSRLHSLWWNGNPTRHNVFLGPHWKHLAGVDAIEEDIAGARVFYPPGAFGQSNLTLSEALIHELAKHVPDDAHIAEFYAGTGAIGLGLAQRARALAMNEVGEDSLRGLQRGIAALPQEAAARCSVVAGEAGEAGEAKAMIDDADTVIVDPPRKGLDPALLAALCATPPARLLYVSCGIDSFARDSETLLT
ncbi:MAG: hypothetical protein QF570_08265, partial [Myxococcota bacterium]|nr:hypothetical protein [Myxococcota bacterium]